MMLHSRKKKCNIWGGGMRKTDKLVTLCMDGSLFNLMANYLKEELKGKGEEIAKFSILCNWDLNGFCTI